MAENPTFIETKFQGPYSWISENADTCIQTCKFHRYSGIYLWTIEYENKELIYYVGQTGRSFSTRMQEHFTEHASGGYHLYDPEEFQRGIRKTVWYGRYDARQRTTISQFLKDFDRLAPIIERLARIYRFWIAPVDLDSRLRNRLESAISLPLFNQSGIVSEFQESGVRYLPRRDEEPPLVAKILNHSSFFGISEYISF